MCHTRVTRLCDIVTSKSANQMGASHKQEVASHVGLTAAHASRAGPHVAGLLVTGGEPQEGSVRSIMQVGIRKSDCSEIICVRPVGVLINLCGIS